METKAQGQKVALAEFLGTAQTRLTQHHTALWEEEKHYTWWAYILFAGLILIYTNDTLGPCQKLFFLVPGSLFGTLMSILGWHVVRCEGEQFHEARQVFWRTFNALGLQHRTDPADGAALPPIAPSVPERPFSKVKKNANKSPGELVATAFRLRRGRLGVRDCFQFSFLILTGCFLGFCGFAVATLLP